MRGTQLKPGWKMVKFGEVVKNATLGEREPQTNGIDRVVGLEHIDPENLHIRRWNSIENGTSFIRRFVTGQTLFGKRRAYQRKVAYAEFEGICSGDILTFESKSKKVLLPELLPFICQSDAFFDYALDTSAGSLSPRTSWKALKDFEFPLPPFDEQKRIAEILWATDEVVEKYALAKAKAERLFAVLLENSIKHIQSSAPERGIRDILDLERPLCYGIVQPGNFVEEGTPFIRVCDMEGGSIKPETLAKVSSQVNQQYRRSVVIENDLLVSIVGTIGRVVKISKECEGFNIARAVARLSSGPEIDPDYLMILLRSQTYQKKLLGGSFETARKTLNLKALGELRIPMPTLEEQHIFQKPIIEVSQKIEGLQIYIENVVRMRAIASNSIIKGVAHV